MRDSAKKQTAAPAASAALRWVLVWAAASLSGCGDDGGGSAARLDAGPLAPRIGCGAPPSVALSCGVMGAMRCDGREDCGAGEVCCGSWQGGFTESRCVSEDDCVDPTDAPTRAFELCHPGAGCAREGTRCGSSRHLPDTMHRCAPALAGVAGQGGGPLDAGSTVPDAGVVEGEVGVVACGEADCGAGMQCCLRPPKAPYCAPAGVACACTPGAFPDAGGPVDLDAGPADAGPADAGQVGAMDASTPTDAST